MKKLVIICGSTATGKTALAIKLAKKFNGELISADSRQIYKSMDIITGKDLPLPVSVWGLDLVEPDQEFSVAQWLEFVSQKTEDLWRRKKLPIIVGGTGFWIKALIEGIDSLGIPPDWELRKKLSNLEIEKLREKLRKLDQERLRRMNQSDRNNPRRLMRAIEIIKTQNSKLKTQNYLAEPDLALRDNLKLKTNKILIIGLMASYKFLYQKIDQRVEERIKQGAQKEVENLIKKGYSWDLPALSAIGYREWRPFFEGKKDINQVIQAWKYSEHGYCRRQITFFKKMKEICWFNIVKPAWEEDVVKLIKTWYD